MLLDPELWAKSGIEFMRELQKRPSMSELLNKLEKHLEAGEDRRVANRRNQKSWHKNCVFEIIPPWRNLKCLGIRIGNGKDDLLYMDFFITWANRLGVWIHFLSWSRRIFLP